MKKTLRKLGYDVKKNCINYVIGLIYVIKKQNRIINTENCRLPESREVRKWAEYVKVIKGTNFSYKISHGDERYTIGNTANNIVVTLVTDGR